MRTHMRTKTGGGPLAFLGDFALIGVLGLVLLALIALGVEGLPAPLPLLRLSLGLFFVLFAPGYALQAALFPRSDDLDGPERLALSFGLSLAAVPPLALILDRLPWGIRLWPIVIAEAAFTVLCSAVALWRRRRLSAEERFIPRIVTDSRSCWPAQDRAGRILYGAVAVAVLLALGSAVASLTLLRPRARYTEFYVLGQQGLAESYPRDAAPGQTLTVTMGIRNLERAPHTYRVELWALDPGEDRQQQVAAAGPFTLEPQQALERVVSWSMPWAGPDQQVEFRLFGDTQPAGSTQPYRLLRLWLDVEQPPR